MDIKIPWDVSSMFGDYLSEETDGADAEEIEAFEISKPRLKVSDVDCSGSTSAEDAPNWTELTSGCASHLHRPLMT